MDSLAMALRRFLLRDLVYVVGGSIVLLAIARQQSWLARDSLALLPTWIVWVGVGLAYVVGHVSQDVFCVLRIVRTAPHPRPNVWLRLIIRGLERRPWQRIALSVNHLYARERRLLEAPGSDDVRDSYERLVGLMMMGTSVGPSCLVAAACLGYRWYRAGCSNVDGWLAGVAMAVGWILVLLSRAKAAQMARFLVEQRIGR
jgi:hypothetical protein